MAGVGELIDRAVGLPPGPQLAAALAELPWPKVPNARLVEVVQARSRQLAHEQAELFAGLVEIAHADPVAKLPAEHPDAVKRSVEDYEWASHEIAAGLTWTPTAADRELAFAATLVEELPLVFAALRAGRIDRNKAWIFVSYLDPDRGELTPEQIHALCARFVPQAPGWTTKQLAGRLYRAIIAIDPDYHRRRYRRAVRERGVALYLDRDGTATLSGQGLPAAEAAAAAARLDRLAEAAKRAGHPGRLAQISADLYLGMLDGSYHGLTEAEILARLLAAPRPEDHPDAGRDGEVEADADGRDDTDAADDPGDAAHDDAATDATDDSGDTDDPGDPDAAEDPEDVGDTRDVGEAGAGDDTAGAEDADAAGAGTDVADDADPAGEEADDAAQDAADAGDEDTAEADHADHAAGAAGEMDAARAGGQDAGDPAPGNGPGPAGRACVAGGHDEAEVAIGAPAPGCVGNSGGAAAFIPGAVGVSSGSGAESMLVGTRLPGCDCADRWAGERVGIREGVEIRVGLATLAGLDERPGEIPGLGPVGAQVARAAVAAQRRGAAWQFALVDTDGHLLLAGPLLRRPRHWPAGATGPPGGPGRVRGGVVELHLTLEELRRYGVDPSGLGGWSGVLAEIADRWADRQRLREQLARDPSARFARGALARHVRVRDRNCCGPGCTRPARRCDLDHTHDHAKGGETVEENVGPGCERHHPDKDRGWTLTQPEPGHFVWESPLGRTYRTRGEPIRPDLPDPQPPPPGADPRDDPHDEDGLRRLELGILWRPARNPGPPPLPTPAPQDDDDEPPF